MEPELTQLFDLRKKESDLISSNTESYGRIPFLLFQFNRHEGQPIVQNAIAQRIDTFRAGLNKIAEEYRQIFHTTSKEDIKKVARTLEESTQKYLENIENSFTKILEQHPYLVR